MPTYIEETEYFTVKDIANARGITPQGVRKAIKESRLCALRVGNMWLIPRRELETRRWIASRD